MSPHFFFSDRHPGTSNLTSGDVHITVTPNYPADPDSREVFIGLSMDYSNAGRGEAWAPLDADELLAAIDKAVGKREEEADRKELESRGSMTIANDIVTQLEELWKNAEPGPFGEDDAIIVRHAGGGDYNIHAKAGYSSEGKHIRVIERAKPKAPEWEAVVASHLHSDDHEREVYFRTEHGGWESETRLTYADELVDPVPLVELPDRDALADAIARGETRRRIGDGGPSPRGYHEADAVLELLKRH